VLVSISIISYFIPYLFMFASMILLQREPAGPVTKVAGLTILLVAGGALVYFFGTRRRHGR
jgi:hypothetical protein